MRVLRIYALYPCFYSTFEIFCNFRIKVVRVGLNINTIVADGCKFVWRFFPTIALQSAQVSVDVEEYQGFVLPDGAVREWAWLFMAFLPKVDKLEDLMLAMVVPIHRT